MHDTIKDRQHPFRKEGTTIKLFLQDGIWRGSLPTYPSAYIATFSKVSGHPHSRSLRTKKVKYSSGS